MSRQSRPELFNRLGPHAGKRFLIDPTDLPFVLVLTPLLRETAAIAHRRNERPAHDAAIAGKFFNLLDMIDGSLDGDALFFSRELRVCGDTEAVVALRNAFDDFEGSALDSVVASFGPLSGPAGAALSAVRSIRGTIDANESSSQDYAAPELVCPAGTPAALRTAVDAGADAVYCGLQNETNARNFPGLNFTIGRGRAVARPMRMRATPSCCSRSIPFRRPASSRMWKDAIDGAAKLGVDAVIVADIGVADYAARTYPDLRLHLSVQAGASSPEAIRFYCEQFGVKRVVLPRMLTVAEIAELHSQIPCEIEAFIFGNIGMMAEGRCYLSQLRHRRVDQHGRRLLAGRRRALRGRRRAQSDHAARRLRDRSLRRG